MERGQVSSKLGDSDLRLMEQVLERPEASYKELSARLGMDQRTVAKRIRALKDDGILRETYEIDWGKLGFAAFAFVGMTTAVGEKNVEKLGEFIKADPRIVEAYHAVGAHQYLVRILQTDLTTLRDSVLRDLEPLTADMTTSLVTSELKRRDYLSLLRYFRESKFPRSRALP